MPDEIRSEILFINNHSCCICSKGLRDNAHLQIHHINGNTSDNRLENLAVLCHECHDKVRDRLWMGNHLSPDEIKKYKDYWEKSISEKRKCLAGPPLFVKEEIDEKIDAKGVKVRRIRREIFFWGKPTSNVWDYLSSKDTEDNETPLEE